MKIIFRAWGHHDLSNSLKVLRSQHQEGWQPLLHSLESALICLLITQPKNKSSDERQTLFLISYLLNDLYIPMPGTEQLGRSSGRSPSFLLRCLTRKESHKVPPLPGIEYQLSALKYVMHLTVLQLTIPSFDTYTLLHAFSLIIRKCCLCL